MNNVFFIADLHAGHRGLMNILRSYNQAHLRGNAKDLREMEAWLIAQWNSRVTKRDQTYVLGDACFNASGVEMIKKLNGNKILLRGNHDLVSYEKLKTAFGSIIGFRKKWGMWLSHAPIHPESLRGLINVHGHLHASKVLDASGEPDKRYVGVSVEQLGGVPISLDEIKEMNREWIKS